jgi:hypothetical protein
LVTLACAYIDIKYVKSRFACPNLQTQDHSGYSDEFSIASKALNSFRGVSQLVLG